ncbi:MAG: hypothetical protein GWP19_00170 [Planctomycetia bacterium]|nr:hypothetical protein [Planctomycetia bacterium]
MKKLILLVVLMTALFGQENDTYGTFIKNFYYRWLMLTDTTANAIAGGQWVQDGRGNLTPFTIDGINNRIGIGKLNPAYTLDVLGTLQATILLGNGAGLTGIGTGTGGIINTGSTTIGADSDVDGVGEIAMQTRGVTRMTFTNSGGITFPLDMDFTLIGGVNGMSIDGTTFSVDGLNNRIGIGTATPIEELEVVGTIKTDTLDADFIEGIGNTITGNDSIFMIIATGQSNMAGQSGGVSAGDLATDARVLNWNAVAGAWVLADPSTVVEAERLHAAYLLADKNIIPFHFAKEIAETYNVQVRLLILASGGLTIGQWDDRGVGTYMDSIRSQLTASGVTEVDCILWHQGESNNGSTNAAYADSLTTVIDQFRAYAEVSAETPFIAGELLYQRSGGGSTDIQNTVYESLRTYTLDPYTAVAKIRHRPDTGMPGSHFSGAGLIDIGRLDYFAAWKNMPNNEDMVILPTDSLGHIANLDVIGTEIINGTIQSTPPYLSQGYYNAFRAVPAGGNSTVGSGLFIGALSEDNAIISSGCYYNSAGNMKPATTTASSIFFQNGNIYFRNDFGLTPAVNFTPTVNMTIVAGGNIGFNEINPESDIELTDNTPYITIHSSNATDVDLTRQGRIIYKGTQSGGEESTLGELEFSHDGAADDEKGQFVLRLNDGNDGTSPTVALVIESGGNVGIGTSNPGEKLHIDEASGTDGTGRWFANASVSTTDATITTIYTLATTTDRNYRLVANVSAAQDDGSNTMGTSWSFILKNVAGTVTESQDAVIGTEFDDSAGVSISGVVSGTDYLIQVTGIVAENWNWELSVDATVVAH